MLSRPSLSNSLDSPNQSIEFQVRIPNFGLLKIFINFVFVPQSVEVVRIPFEKLLFPTSKEFKTSTQPFGKVRGLFLNDLIIEIPSVQLHK